MSMLTVDPTQRITITEIRKNPWFLKDLPEYLLPLPQVLDTNDIQVDDAIVDKVAKVCISRLIFLENGIGTSRCFDIVSRSSGQSSSHVSTFS
jgi:hypothetical protein